MCSGAEAAGADAVWATDHLFWGRPTLECLSSLAVAAMATERAVVGSCVLQLPLRTPAAVAKQATALQLISGGRFVLGVGVGSHAGEYELAGTDFATRGARMDEGIDALRRCWETAGDPSAGYRQAPAAEVPVWIGGSSPAARRRAARAGDGWIPLFLPPRELGEAVARLREETAAAGRDPADVTAATVMVACVGDDARMAAASGTAWLGELYGLPAKAFERHLVAGPATHCAEAARRYLDAGAEHVAVMIAGDRTVEQFAGLAAAFGTPGAANAAALSGAELAGVGA